MFILSTPYVSDYLKNTVIKNKIPVLDNSAVHEQFFGYELLLNDEEMVKEFKKIQNPKLYTNSEDSIAWIIKNLSDSEYPLKINLFKNKVLFRKLLKKMYPDFYFREVSLEELKHIKKTDLKYPFILKPAVGFLSFGVYSIKNSEEFQTVINKIDIDIAKYKGIFPIEVVDTSKFIIEQMINGDEYAVDVYYGNDGRPVILNIFRHPFYDSNDVSDRVYYTSKDIIKSNLNRFNNLFEQIGTLAGLKNFTAHIELKVDGNLIIPIEVNPMRFTGWCITDIADFAYGINPYEYYIKDLKPDWDSILNKIDNSLYYFICAEVPNGVDKIDIKEMNYQKFISKLDNVIDVRKQDFKTKPLFAIVFGKTQNYEKIREILSMDMNEFVIRK